MAKIIQRDELVGFTCPGCKRTHWINVGTDLRPGWYWNGSVDKPSFQPSVLVTYPGADAGQDGAPPAACHSFVTDGNIQFLGDSMHSLVNQTVELPEVQ